MEARLLIAFKRETIKDPYYLIGEEKTRQINLLFQIQDDYEKIANPSEIDRERYYLSCLWLEAESMRREKQFRQSAMAQSKRKHKIVQESVDRFKTIMKLQFMEKFKDNIACGKFTPEMSAEMDRMNRMESAACYHISGIKVTMQDCNKCEHKSCKTGR